ncbi:CheR family methyltransferase [Allohahella sp. A8]|uniref:CheR family methyltransferase n=1 Tax=Allohahella sp. A8 TaxID=3141461 RepID=UPI003A802A66
MSNRKARDFEYTEQDFEKVRQLIYQRVGINLGPNKMEMVYSRLSRRLRTLGVPDMKAYLQRLERADSSEWQEFVNALTTNLTAFFREAHHFEYLVSHLRKKARGQKVKLWCCAASTGEEPYSIVIALLDAFGTDYPFELVATDVDTNALQAARNGVYDLERLKGMDDAMVAKYFMKGVGKNAGLARVKNVLADRVTFAPLNLLSGGWKVPDALDIIFCRNVFIYFDKETQGTVLQRFHRILKSDGLLFAGHSESLLTVGAMFQSIGRTVYKPTAQLVRHSDESSGDESAPLSAAAG